MSAKRCVRCCQWATGAAPRNPWALTGVYVCVYVCACMCVCMSAQRKDGGLKCPTLQEGEIRFLMELKIGNPAAQHTRMQT